ncbi:MAG: prepilin peptidase, partial [Chloroflexi bacterium]|nr:prepilin peptidase [Chloroflexota bacterium]
MTPLVAVFLGLAGLAVGSFLNLCADRLPLGQSILGPRSHCPSCQRPIAALDLVPVLNYLWLRGRCRYCKARIPRRLPIVELATGGLFAYIGLRYGLTPQAATAALFVSILIVVFVIDLEQGLILNRLVYPSALVAFGLAPVGLDGSSQGLGWAYLDVLAGGGLAFVVLLVIYLASRGGLGPGDVKLGALLGLMLGLRSTMVALPIAFIAGGLVALALLALKRRGLRGTMPFGPFLSGATILVLFAGTPIREWY